MSPITASEAAHRPVTTDAQLEERVAEIVGRASRRQLWMLFLDAESRQLPLLLPIEDFPSSPEEGAATLLVEQLSELVEHVSAAHVVLVWERRLGEASTPGDRLWAAGMARECRRHGVALRAQFLSHRTGVRLLTEAEYGASGYPAASGESGSDPTPTSTPGRS